MPQGEVFLTQGVKPWFEFDPPEPEAIAQTWQGKSSDPGKRIDDGLPGLHIPLRDQVPDDAKG